MRIWKYILSVLLLTIGVIGISFSEFPDTNLHIVACNIGQGDAILIFKGNVQILTDGGPDKSVLECLGRYMPFWDREVELVISTHPDADHSSGLVDVFKNYKVDDLLINPIDSGTSVYEALKKEVGRSQTNVINPMSGMELGLDLIYLDILEPTEDQLGRLSVKEEGSNLSKYSVSRDTNLYSIVYKLSFKNFTGLFPGDIPPSISDSLAANWSTGYLDYIKIPHHGSINGLTENLLKALMPKIAVISLGKNSWGFPRPEILDMLSRYKVRVLRTDSAGDVEVITDGTKYWIKNS